MSEVQAMLGALVEAGVLSDSDRWVGDALTRLGADVRPAVALAVALAARAPRHGHVCVELDRIFDDLGPAPRELAKWLGAAQAGPAMDRGWPASGDWLVALRSSSIVRTASEDGSCPLVLDGSRLYLDRYWRYQERLVVALNQRMAAKAPEVDAGVLKKGLAAWFPPMPAGEMDRQRLGAIVAVLSRVSVVSGGPGTGKTTTITRVLALLLEQARAVGQPLRVALAAPTGKAALRVKESIASEMERIEAETPLHPELREELARAPSSTLHRLLGYRPNNPTRFRHDHSEPLPYDVVVVDEASMVSFAMMSKLVSAVHPDARLILLGDRDQLTSIDAGAVLGDLCNPRSGELQFSHAMAERLAPFVSDGKGSGRGLSEHAQIVDDVGIWDALVQFDRYFRFGHGSGIGGVARAIQRGDADSALAYLSGERTEGGEGDAYADVDLGSLDEEGRWPADRRAQIVEGYRTFLEVAMAPEAGEEALDALDSLRVLCAHRRGPEGVETLNPLIEGWLAEAVDGFDSERVWYLGRPVIVTENDYGLRLFNGDVGVVVIQEGRRVVCFRRAEGGVRFVSPARLPPCETVFAMSIHKSQGSQFGHAVVVLPRVSSRVLTRELVYTAVTRARSRVSVLGSPEILRECLARPVRRASGLRDLLWPPGPSESEPSPGTAPVPSPGTAPEGDPQLSLF